LIWSQNVLRAIYSKTVPTGPSVAFPVYFGKTTDLDACRSATYRLPASAVGDRPVSSKAPPFTSLPANDEAGFPLNHLLFAQTWAAMAPGGWDLAVSAEAYGELVSVTPPWSLHPSLFITLEQGVVVTRFRPAGGTARASVDEDDGCHSTLTEALLALCPLMLRLPPE